MKSKEEIFENFVGMKPKYVTSGKLNGRLILLMMEEYANEIRANKLHIDTVRKIITRKDISIGKITELLNEALTN